MSNKNYRNYNKPQTEVVPEPIETEVEEVVETVEEVVEEATEEVVEEPKGLIGEVVDCKKLRVRNSPSTTALVLCEIAAGTKVVVDPVKSTKDWAAICTEVGASGFCMKQFIKVTK